MRLRRLAKGVGAFDARPQDALAHQVKDLLGSFCLNPAVFEEETHAHSRHHLRAADTKQPDVQWRRRAGGVAEIDQRSEWIKTLERWKKRIFADAVEDSGHAIGK